jgi:hypothetical protein
MTLSPKRLTCRLLLTATFAFYVFSQTLILKEQATVMQSILTAMMAAAACAMLIAFPTEARLPLRSASTLLIVASVVLSSILFSEPREVLVVLVKVLFLLMCVSLLHNVRGSRQLISVADGVVASIVIIAALESVGVIPGAEGYSAAGHKRSLGLTNPNAPMYFMFSSIVVYYLAGSTKRMHMAAAGVAVLYMLDAFSRTYALATIILIALDLAARSSFARRMVRLPLFLMTLMVYFCGSAFFLVGTALPELFIGLVGSRLDEFLSLRFSTVLLTSADDGMTLTGIKFAAQDSMYHELIFVLGPAFWLAFMVAIGRLGLSSLHVPSHFRLFAFMAIVVMVGLVEGVFLKLTLFSGFALALAVMPPNMLMVGPVTKRSAQIQSATGSNE